MAYIEGFMTRVEDRIEEKSAFCKRQIELLMTIPGVSTLTAQGIIAEIGTKLTWLKPIGFNNSYALMMRRKHANQIKVETISDLKRYLFNE